MYKNLVSRSFLIISTYCLLLLLFFLFLQNNEIVQSVQFPDSNIPKDLSKFKFYSVAENNTNNSTTNQIKKLSTTKIAELFFVYVYSNMSQCVRF